MHIITGCCGLECSACPAFIAGRDDDDELRKKTAREWSEMFQIDITPESINCAGCLASGVHGPYCGMCEIRSCAMEKALESCAFCPDYGCAKLQKVHVIDEHCKKRLDALRGSA
jgi:hypothetical protein